MGRHTLVAEAISLLRMVVSSARDLAPIVLVVAFFQLVVIQQPVKDLGDIVLGFLFVMVGLAFFLQGLEMALFPLGESLAEAFARKGSVFWLLTFSFGLGFGTTVAEPALIAVCEEAAMTLAAAGVITGGEDGNAGYALALRYTVAVAVGTSILVGVLRILRGWPLHWMIISGYGIVTLLTLLAPAEIIGIAYDSGGVTTSTITVPLVTALGVGLSTVIRGRNPMIDGFGLIAFASLTPIMFVLVLGVVVDG